LLQYPSSAVQVPATRKRDGSAALHNEV